ncbi:hypothetical protein ABZP36_011830 [Zizania latifolia]
MKNVISSAMELERAPPSVLPTCMLQQPPSAPSTVGGRSARTSLLSATVQEVLMVQKSNKVTMKPPPRFPPGGAGGRSVEGRKGTEPLAPKRAARARQPPAKKVARSILRRGAPPPDQNRNVLTCCCAWLPSGLRCALHQVAPGRSWIMRPQRSAAIGAGAGKAVVPRACGRGRWLFSEYARWRRSVWMPSRFYLESVDRHEPRAAIAPTS